MKFQAGFVRSGLSLLLLAAGPAVSGRAAAADYRPPWITAYKSDDSIYMFRVGTATGADSASGAREAALADALRVILDELMARGGQYAELYDIQATAYR